VQHTVYVAGLVEYQGSTQFEVWRLEARKGQVEWQVMNGIATQVFPPKEIGGSLQIGRSLESRMLPVLRYRTVFKHEELCLTPEEAVKFAIAKHVSLQEAKTKELANIAVTVSVMKSHLSLFEGKS